MHHTYEKRQNANNHTFRTALLFLHSLFVVTQFRIIRVLLLVPPQWISLLLFATSFVIPIHFPVTPALSSPPPKKFARTGQEEKNNHHQAPKKFWGSLTCFSQTIALQWAPGAYALSTLDWWETKKCSKLPRTPLVVHKCTTNAPPPHFFFGGRHY